MRIYYQQFEEQQTQSLIDQRIKEHLGQTAAFQQVGAAYNQHLMVQRPRLPVLPTPVMPMPGGAQMNSPFYPGMRPPVMPRPMPPPGKLEWNNFIYLPHSILVHVLILVCLHFACKHRVCNLILFLPTSLLIVLADVLLVI